MKGDLSKLEGQLQKAYGLSKEEATKKFNEFKSSLSTSSYGEEKVNKTSFASDVNQPSSKKRSAHH